MRTEAIPFAMANVLCGALLLAQQPTDQQPTDPRPAAAADVLLMPLQSLANDTIYHRQPTAGGVLPQGGPAAFVPFAKIRDAKFSPDGRLVALLVESATETKGETPTRRELLARHVQWDTLNKRWITTDPNLKFAELGEAGKPTPMPSNATAPKDRTLLASEIVQSTIVVDRPTPQPTKDEKAAPNAPVPVFWLVPSQQVLAFAVIEQEKHHVPLPWSLLRLADAYGKTAFTVDGDATRLRDAPHGDVTHEPPTAELRQRVYRHFAIAPPAWETPAPIDPPQPKAPEPGATPRR